MLAWVRRDLSKPALPPTVVVYYALFFHAFWWYFLVLGLYAVFRHQIPESAVPNPIDRFIVTRISAGLFAVLIGFATYQMTRVYTRLAASDEDIGKVFPPLANDDFVDGRYYKRFGCLPDYVLRCAGLLYLLYLERWILKMKTRFSELSLYDFMSVWAWEIAYLYAALIMYSLFINLPRWRWSHNEVAKSQASGFVWSDLYIVASWVVLMIGFNFFSGPRGTAYVAVILTLIVSAVLFWWSFMEESRRPLIEPVAAYFNSHSWIKNIGTLCLLVGVWEFLTAKHL